MTGLSMIDIDSRGNVILPLNPVVSLDSVYISLDSIAVLQGDRLGCMDQYGDIFVWP
jgi:hypothetical protein